jgi:hypothetical protein
MEVMLGGTGNIARDFLFEVVSWRSVSNASAARR